MFKIFKMKDIVFILLFIFIIGATAHFTLIDRIGFWRLVYPLQAQIAVWNINCSANAPKWMPKSLKYIIKNQKNLSNQIAYIDSSGHQFYCQSGWEKTTVFSNKASENTRFRYASMTKIITNNAILDLINNGKIKLDDPMVNFFDELNGKNLKDERIKKITISDLLQQRSGFDRLKSEDVIFAMNKTPWCPSQLSTLLKLKLDFEPNDHYAYDNRNTCLLGAVIERVTQQPYRAFIQKTYSLAKYNIKFVDGIYYPDEVRYDFRNNDFWTESDDNSFNFQSISSSAGLSGSAKSLALLIHSMLQREHLNILDIAEDNLKKCHITQFKSCNGYAMWQYQKDSSASRMYFRNGGFPAATSLAMVTAKSEVVVWVGNGATRYDKDYDENLLEKYFYQTLNDQSLK
ncbi:serine hydrolase domain-containing protein [Acinetobacter sp. NIPH 2100]|uniref:serine hydrolase domain-containing protein n=1 Tax=Acinetobacter sp. NIPH 2100 TaxID=1217708 RepID=UPI0002CD9E1E|nr:serine hydrolase domain-containing protein [Acinetobacter sp. NIPH 2100]ENX38211.1 hypothetical protein F887_03372 [Acinetobacter sp. NIPH 2100]